MAENQYVNKVTLSDGTVLIDLTGITVDAAHLLAGTTAVDRSGATITGTSTYDMDTSGMTAAAAEILSGKTAGIAGQVVTGTMPNNGTQTLIITTKDQEVSIPQGYIAADSKAIISTTEQAKIIAANIKAGIEILGVTGTYGGEEVTAQVKTATPSWQQQTVLPDAGYDYLSQVTVNAIPYAETDNAQGGKTATIG